MATKLTKPAIAHEESGLGLRSTSRQRRRINSGLKPVWVCKGNRSAKCDACARHRHGGQDSLRDLSLLKTDPTAMMNIRELVRGSDDGRRINRMSNNDIIERFEHLLRFNYWRICAPELIEPPAPIVVAGNDVAPRQELAPPTPRRAPPPPPPPVRPDSPTFPPRHDAAAQAGALVEAAQSGVPFCEECEKLRQQQTQKA